MRQKVLEKLTFNTVGEPKYVWFH